MKKILTLWLCLLMLLSLAACGSDEVTEEQMITRPAEVENVNASAEVQTSREPILEEASQQAAAPAVVGNYTFDANGVELIPGDPFDPGILPEPVSVYQVPSCAIEGTDNLYNYGSFELTAFDDGTSELIYSILLTDPNITTTEGLALGDSVQKVTEIYGEGYTQEGNAYVYTGDAEILYIIVQGDYVASIEYRMIVD